MNKKTRTESETLTNKSIQKLKIEANSRNSAKFNTTNGDPCWLWILNRGEQLFFYMNGKAAIFEISATYDFLEVESIRDWDNGTRISDSEKSLIIKIISDFWISQNGTKIRILGRRGKEILAPLNVSQNLHANRI